MAATFIIEQWKYFLTHQFMIKYEILKLWPFYEEKRRTSTLPITHVDHFYVLQYILAAHTHTQAYALIHTPTLNTGSVIQSVKSIWCVSWLAAWGVRQTGRRRLRCRWPWRQQPCAPERSEREQYSEKVHVPLYQLNDGYCSPWVPRLHRRHHTQRPGGGTKVDDDNCPCCGPKKLVQFINKTTFSPSRIQNHSSR